MLNHNAKIYKKVEMGERKPKKRNNMTLKGYYLSIPGRESPRYEFLKELAEKCGVTVSSARNWCLYGMKPQNKEHIEIICEFTGLSEESLWKE